MVACHDQSAPQKWRLLVAALCDMLRQAKMNLGESEAAQVELRHAMHCTVFYGAACVCFVLSRPLLRVVASSLARRRHHQLVTAAAKLLRSGFILLPEAAPLRPALERIAAAERTPRSAFVRLFSDECARVIPCAMKCCAKRYVRSLVGQLVLVGIFRAMDVAVRRGALLPTFRGATLVPVQAVSGWSAVAFYDFSATVPSEMSLRWPRCFALSDFFVGGGLPLARYLPGLSGTVARLIATVSPSSAVAAAHDAVNVRTIGFRDVTLEQLHTWTKSWSWSTHVWWCGTHWLADVVDDVVGAQAQLMLDARRSQRSSSTSNKSSSASSATTTTATTATNNHTHAVNGSGEGNTVPVQNRVLLQGIDDSVSSSNTSSQRLHFFRTRQLWKSIRHAGKHIGKSLLRFTIKCSLTALVALRAQRWRWLRHVPLVGAGGEAYAAVCLCFVILRRV